METSFQDQLFRFAEKHRSDDSPPWTAEHAGDQIQSDEDQEGVVGTWISLGMRKSLAAPLGEEIWTMDPTIARQTEFTAASYRLEYGPRIGFVRIPRYSHDPARAQAFGDLIRRFEGETDALLIDQQYNPGGSLLQMYAMCAFLTDRPLPVPLHQVKLWDNDAPEAQDVMERLQYGLDLPEADRPTPYEVRWSKFVLQHAERGKGVLSDPTPLFGIAEIEPAPYAYSKPIFILSNALTFSAGEFLAAILKDNGRAILLGENTAGAGGCARSFEMTGLFNARISMTWTVAWRRNGLAIENTGIAPDVHIAYTREDIVEDYARFRHSIGWTMALMLHELKGISILPELRDMRSFERRW
ncbi:S41 family peptidase [Rhizobium sp. BT-175]|uniref:S41 family peptidase n=1 Tax=Rhizobium sp. BT-175 TaxID=2986929 RepID=UPI00355678CB